MYLSAYYLKIYIYFFFIPLWREVTLSKLLLLCPVRTKSIISFKLENIIITSVKQYIETSCQTVSNSKPMKYETICEINTQRNRKSSQWNIKYLYTKTDMNFVTNNLRNTRRILCLVLPISTITWIATKQHEHSGQ